ncbi:MAG: hypothetical protein JJE52_13225 [Acidimicrobiia bacterium]|nr:hypothetical protein [Acidimicrobiia bacterium]
MARRAMLVLAMVMALVLGACGDDDAETTVSTSDDVSTSSTAPTTSPPDPTTTSNDTSATGSTEDPPTTLPAGDVPEVDLAGDGLVLVGDDTVLLAFDISEAEVLDGLVAALGEPDGAGPEEECPAGPADFARFSATGLSLTFQGGNFVGWSARPTASLETAEGIGVGSTVGELTAAYPETTIKESSLGWEFSAGGLYGVASSDTDGGVIETMWAGTTCIFR